MTMRGFHSLAALLLSLFIFVAWPASALAQTVARPPKLSPVKASVVWSDAAAQPGDRRIIAVVIEIADNFHVMGPASSLGEKSDYIATNLRVKQPTKAGATQAFRVGEVQYPQAKTITVSYSGTAESLAVYESKAILYVPVVVAKDASLGKHAINLTLTYQACDDKTCLMPVDKKLVAELEVTTGAATATAPATDANLFAKFDARGFDAIADKSSATASSGSNNDPPQDTVPPRPSKRASGLVKFDFFGHTLSIDPASFAGFLGLLALAALGGLLLNFTPCVLPIIPIKIMGLSQAAGNRARCFALGAATSLGVLAFWVLLAAGMIALTIALKGKGHSFTGGATNQLFQSTFFTIGVGVLIAVLAVGMCGVFSLRLPRFVYSFTPKLESPFGSFNLGIMTAVLSTPCTAPFMGAAAAWAVLQAPIDTLLVFGAIGVGMAAPYLLLSAFPALVHRMPRSGPASELIKQVMGIFMLAAAAYFIGVGVAGATWFREPIDPPSSKYWWIVMAFIAIAGAWLGYRSLRTVKSGTGRGVLASLGVATVVLSIFGAFKLTSDGPITWTAYTPARYEEALKNGKVVVLDFTAEWCINCKVLEATVLNSDRVARQLGASGVVPMKVDITSKANVDGIAKLAHVGRVAIPVLVVVGPSGNETLNSDAYTAEQVIDAIESAMTNRK